MAVKLKTKVALGGLFLFALLILVGAVSFFYFNRLTEDSKEIVKNNYETLNYSRDMMKELDALTGKDSITAFNIFEKTLQSQEENITETGEKEMTESLRKKFNRIKQEGMIDSLPPLIRKDIGNIMQVNLKAIDNKNQAVQASAERAKT
ncbi:MAG: PAS domain-containing sensor histidine kinase, partial [Chitinophagaceae bacterium]